MKKNLLILLFMAGWMNLAGQGSDEAGKAMRFRYLVFEKQYEQAKIFAEENRLPDNQDPAIIKTKIEMWMGLSDLDAAAATAHDLMAFDPATAHYLLATIEMRRDDPTTALVHLKKHLEQPDHYSSMTIRRDPAFEQVEMQRDWINLWKESRYSSQEERFSEGLYHLNNGELNMAEELGQMVVGEDPNSRYGWLLISMIRYQQGEKRDAADAIDRVLQKGIGDVRFLELLFNWLQETNQSDKAVNVALQLRRLDPSNPEYLIWLVISRINSGQENSAMREMALLEECGVESAELSYIAGKSMIRRDPGKALVLLNKAVDSGILDKRFFNGRAEIFTKLSNQKAAIEDLSMSLDIDPRQADIWFTRAQLRNDSGDQEGACHDWERALQLGHRQAADRLYKFCRN